MSFKASLQEAPMGLTPALWGPPAPLKMGPTRDAPQAKGGLHSTISELCSTQRQPNKTHLCACFHAEPELPRTCPRS